MARRIEVITKSHDTRATIKKRLLSRLDISGSVDDVQVVDVYTVDGGLSDSSIERVARVLENPVLEHAQIDTPALNETFSWALEVGYRPAVTDNVGSTTKETIEDLLLNESVEGVYSSQMLLLSGELSREDVEVIADEIANPLIERTHIKSAKDYLQQGGMDVIVPKVSSNQFIAFNRAIRLSDMSDEELEDLSRYGIPDLQGNPAGPLGLSLEEMKVIQTHFDGGIISSMELESIAQTWSEHCKHKIFASPIDEIERGLYKTFIQGATKKIREQKGDKDFCVSVFKDNSGIIVFDEDYFITDKAETHNSPSALDPFGGSITGIVGVNRDAMGTGLGAKPIVNGYGYCCAHPNDSTPLFRDKERTRKMLSPRRILEGIVEGVKEGGNCSGIPTTQGFVYFDKRYKGKPLVFVRTVGLLPRESAGRPSHEKKAEPGDYIVMVGGRVGKDGIHGATFSSAALDADSPATAVQIGDPITQKKMSDALIKEARDKGLYRSITDNGAGGLSCSVGEMAQESGGAQVQLELIPTKYDGMHPWEIWVSESQERMTLAVPKEKWSSLSALLRRHGVEGTVIGEFTDSGRCVVMNHHLASMDLDLDFLHDGAPLLHLKTQQHIIAYSEPVFPSSKFFDTSYLTFCLHSMLSRLNVGSFAHISEQYDHEVQGGSVLKPLQGRGRINGDATVVRPRLDSEKGIVLSQGINPSYSEIDAYQMAANAIDTAVRNAVCAGANIEKIALMDNFCWCSSDDPTRLWQLRSAAAACYETAVAFGTPFISGKDSMFNDFKGFDKNGDPITISVPPTLLISSLGIIDDVMNTVSLDAKMPGDSVYVLGLTADELGGSEYYALMGEVAQKGEPFIGNTVPTVDLHGNRLLYKGLTECIEKGLVVSAQSVHRGGLAVALAKTAMGGQLGMRVNLSEYRLKGFYSRTDFALFSESAGRVVVTVSGKDEREFEKHFSHPYVSKIGQVTNDGEFCITGIQGEEAVHTTVDGLLQSYRHASEVQSGKA